MPAANPSKPPDFLKSLVHAPESPLVDLLRACKRMAPSDASVLINGETGTGKEVVARFLHLNSSRPTGPFVPVNCGAIPEALLESELFGHVRGAFTGAVAARKGRVALAEGGTLFLDEVGELPLSLQVKLLRLLQERAYEPVGSAESVAANFRLVAATHRDLAAEVAAGRFRRDLYYRLMVCPLELPPLRARKGDISTLFRHFWHALGDVRPVSHQVFQALEAYPWPGNVRELENLVERLSVCVERGSVELSDLPSAFLTQTTPPEPRVTTVMAATVQTLDHPSEISAQVSSPPQTTTPPAFPVDLPALLRQLEERYIEAALEHASGNKKAAADMLGLQRTTLVEKLRRRDARSVSGVTPMPMNATA